MKRKGRLYGIGVGPGDPELMTLKAVKRIEEAEVIALPNKNKEDCVAYQIAKGAVDNLDEKQFIYLHMPMTKDKKQLEESHEEAAKIVEDCLAGERDVVFLTLGDVTVYSTYLYIHRRVLRDGYEAEIVPGITSFCAAAAALNIGLVEGKEQLHVIPASYAVEDAMELPGTKVLMKSGKSIGKVKQYLIKNNFQGYMVENCGMENEKIYRSLEEIDENAGYYSLMVVKDEKQEEY